MKPLIIVSGPTASGKTGLSVKIARELHAEIINCDSVQVYREFDIGSAKPTEAEKSDIRHHLLDYVDPIQDFNASDFASAASQIISSLNASNRTSVIVGGTTMYLTSLIHGLAKLPTSDKRLREQLEALSSEVLYEELKSLDAERAEKLHVNDRVRVIRALEIIKGSDSVSAQYEAHPSSEVKYPSIILVPCWPREKLYQRIDARAASMVERGLEKEVEKIISRYGVAGTKALSSLGYRQAMENREASHPRETPEDREASSSILTEAIAKQTRRYAKRQLTFWRNEPSKRGWIQKPSQLDPESNVLKSEFTPTRPSQEVKDFAVLSLTGSELVDRLKQASAVDAEGVEVWYLDAEALLSA